MGVSLAGWMIFSLRMKGLVGNVLYEGEGVGEGKMLNQPTF